MSNETKCCPYCKSDDLGFLLPTAKYGKGKANGMEILLQTNCNECGARFWSHFVFKFTTKGGL